MNRGTLAEIDLNALAYNFRTVKKLSGNRPVIAVVKADAYGHGAVEVSRRLVRCGAECLAVAFTAEARELREAGIASPIIVLFDSDPDDILKYDLTPVITCRKNAEALSKEAEKNGREVPVHIKIDTGMGRLGLRLDELEDIPDMAGLKGIRIEGVMSHFSEADLLDASFARLQIDRFAALRQDLAGKGLQARLFHLANSAAVMSLPESHFDAVRPGLMLYGCSPLQRSGVADRNPGLLPVMTVKAGIVALRKLPVNTPVGYGRTFITQRESVIGIISVGYADGLSRRFSNNAEVLVKGKRAPVVGRVCMDLTMIDVTGIDGVTEGDEIVIIGKQSDESIDAFECASRVDSIPYEILTSLGNRAKKVYIDDKIY